MQIANHFGTYYRYPIEVYRITLQSMKHNGCAAPTEHWNELRLPQDGIASIEDLKIRNGFACKDCRARMMSDELAKDHLKCGGNIIHAYLQCWNKTAARKY